MQIDGWQINENELQRFDRKWREKWHAWDRLFECQTSDIACLVYSIGEVAMNRLVGRLAIYQCKTNPVLVLNPRGFECCFWDSEDPVEYSRTGRILFVKGDSSSRGPALFSFVKGGSSSRGPVPISVIDLDSRRFAVVRKGELSSAPAVHEIAERTFRLDFLTERGDGESAVVDLDELEWHDVRKL